MITTEELLLKQIEAQRVLLEATEAKTKELLILQEEERKRRELDEKIYSMLVDILDKLVDFQAQAMKATVDTNIKTTYLAHALETLLKIMATFFHSGDSQAVISELREQNKNLYDYLISTGDTFNIKTDAIGDIIGKDKK